MLTRAGLVFGIAIALYAACWLVDAHLRTRRGPWEVAFTREPGGEPAIVIAEPHLGVRDVRIVFVGETLPPTNSPATLRFDRPRPELPFGRVVYDDLMYLPGAVTFDLFGHEIELLPMRLGVNRTARPWTSGEVLRLLPDQKPPPRPAPARRRGADARQ